MINYMGYISECQFRYENPYDINENIIDLDLPVFLQKVFRIQAFKIWTFVLHRGDVQSPIIYKKLYEKIKCKDYVHFNNLNNKQLIEIYDFFERTISEEIRHLECVDFLVKKCGYQFNTNQLTPFGKFELAPYLNSLDLNQKLLEKLTDPALLLKNLFDFYTIESQGQTVLSMINKYSSNRAKKDFFKPMLQEESQHTLGFFKVIKAIKKNVTSADLIIVENYLKQPTLRYEYFGLLNLSGFFIICDKILKNEHLLENFKKTLLNSLKTNKFQQEYHNKICKKIYRFYHELFPEMTENEFAKILENNVKKEIESLEIKK